MANTQAFVTDSKDSPPTSAAPKPRNLGGANAGVRDIDDGASIRSYAPTVEAAGYQESILGEVMGPTEKSEQEKSLLRSLGQRFVDAESQSLFPPDPEFEAAFRREFDDVDDLDADGSNQGQALVVNLGG